MVHGLSYSAICGIFPDQGWNLVLLLGTKVKGTAGPGNFTQTGLEMTQNWVSGAVQAAPFLFTPSAPRSQPKPGLFKVGRVSPTQWEIKYKLAPFPPPEPYKSA